MWPYCTGEAADDAIAAGSAENSGCGIIYFFVFHYLNSINTLFHTPSLQSLLISFITLKKTKNESRWSPNNPDGTSMYTTRSFPNGFPMFAGCPPDDPYHCPAERTKTPAIQAAYYNFYQVTGIDLNYREKVYCPAMNTQDLSTPRMHGSTMDLNFNTDEYVLSGMEPSHSLQSMLPRRAQTGRGRAKQRKCLIPSLANSTTPIRLWFWLGLGSTSSRT